MSNGVPPFLLPDIAAVAFEPWQQRGDPPVPLPAFVGDWDYSTTLYLSRILKVDVSRVRREASLPDDVPLMVVVEWMASASQTSGRACRTVVPEGGGVHLSADLPGQDLGGTLVLTTRLVLGLDVASPQPFLAGRAGDVLREEVTRTQLEGSAGRLSTYVVDFAQAGLDPDARWHVEFPPSLDAPAQAAFQLYLNAADREIVNAVTNAGKPTPVQRRLLDWLETDLACRLVEAGLHEDWRDVLDDYSDAPESIGASLRSLLGTLFPDDSPTSVAALRDADPGHFHSHLQGALRRMRVHSDDALPAVE